MDSELLNRLPGDLPRIARLIGLEHTVALINEFGGAWINIPKCDAILREIRNREIRAYFDSHPDEDDLLRKLAAKHRLTVRQIQNILGGVNEEDAPLPLFNLLKPER